MKYHKIILERYKGIKEPIEIDFSKNSLMPIIGINECGKTTILNGIFAFDHTNDTYNSTIRQVTDVHNLYSTKPEPAIITAILEINKTEFEEIYDSYISQQNKSKNDAKTKFRLGRSQKFPNTVSITRKISADGSKYALKEKMLLKGIIDESEFCEDIIRFTPFILYFDDFRDSFPDKLEIKKESDIRNSWIGIVEELFKKTDPSYSIYKLAKCDKRLRDNILFDVQKKLNDTLTKEWANFRLDERDPLKIKIAFEIEDASGDGVKNPPVSTRAVPAEATDKKTKVEKHYLSFEVVEKNPEGRERAFYIRDRSKGFYWFFNFVMKLEFNPKVQGSINDTIYLLDEPGSYLHPFAQNKLCKKLLDLSKNGKVVYCTHTHYLLDPNIVPLNTIHIASKSTFGDIKLVRCNDYLTSNSSLESAFQPIFDALYIKPFHLDFTYKKVLVVEGIYDFYAFSMFRAKDDYGIVPGRGATTLNSLISIMIGFGIDFKVLWDNDAAGQESRKNLRSILGTKSQPDIFILCSKEIHQKPYCKIYLKVLIYLISRRSSG